MQPAKTDPPESAAAPRPTTRRGVLRDTVGVAATLASLPLVSGLAAAHFPHDLSIDVQPQDEDSALDLDDDETVTVAVHPSTYLDHDERATFDPAEAANRYRFGSNHTVADGEGARPEGDGELKEVEGHDGTHEALFLEFPLADAGFDGGEETAWLYWERDESGEHGLSGVDTVTVLGGETGDRALLGLLRRLLSPFGSQA